VPYEYYDVVRDPEAREAMMRWSKGSRQVPVIVEDGRVTIGFGGT